MLWPQAMAAEAFAAADLPQRLEAGAIGLPTAGCELTSVTEKWTQKGIHYTEVLASIHPIDASAPDIHIEVNLPDNWNGRMVQFGGGGFNGTLVTADGAAAGADAAELTLLEQGYAAYGGDSGHTGDIWDASFAANKEALHNFAHELSGDALAAECRMDIDGMLYRVFIGGPVTEAAIVGKTRDLVFFFGDKKRVAGRPQLFKPPGTLIQCMGCVVVDGGGMKDGIIVDGKDGR